MKEEDIRGCVLQFLGAAAHDDQAAAAEAAGQLVAGLLVDVNRIANALELISSTMANRRQG